MHERIALPESGRASIQSCGPEKQQQHHGLKCQSRRVGQSVRQMFKCRRPYSRYSRDRRDLRMSITTRCYGTVHSHASSTGTVRGRLATSHAPVITSELSAVREFHSSGGLTLQTTTASSSAARFIHQARSGPDEDRYWLMVSKRGRELMRRSTFPYHCALLPSRYRVAVAPSPPNESSTSAPSRADDSSLDEQR